MYIFVTILSIVFTTTECANYQRYDATYRYPGSTIAYNSYSNVNPYRTSSYGNDIANFPEGTRYPNYSPGYSTTRNPFYNDYSTTGYNTQYSRGSTNMNFNQGYNLDRLGNGYNQNGNNYNGYNQNGYNQNGYNQNGYNQNGYNQNGYNQNGYGRSGMQGGYTSYETPFMRDIGTCVNRSPQNGIWVDSLMGMWYGVEVIQHLGADSRVDYRVDARTCIVVHIAEPKERPSTENQLYHVQHINAKFRQEYRHLRLLWDEAGQTSEYAMFFRNESAGYWHVINGQNGTLTHLPKYQQFSGSVQVMKAVNDHLVLNFCQEADAITGRPAQLYSILLSRTPGELTRWEIESIHGLLQTKRLSVASRRMVCGNSSADRPFYSMLLSFLTCLFAYVIGTS